MLLIASCKCSAVMLHPQILHPQILVPGGGLRQSEVLPLRLYMILGSLLSSLASTSCVT